MSNNYSEQIFQSIDTIISQRLNEVSFDKTEICKIVNWNKDYPNRYQVTNEAGLKYEAYSSDDNKKYLEGQKVYVIVPQGNYELRKLIIGGYSTDEIPKNLYVNPFNHLVTSSTLSLPNSIWAKVNDEEYDEWKDIPSNETKPNSIEFLTNFKYKNIQDFDYIGLDFSFNTNIIGYQGSYALKISLWNDETDLTKDDNTLILSSKNLYGNPYNLNSSLSFQHLFPWPTRKKDNKIEPIPITEITKIKLQLIQDNNFLKKQNETDVNVNTWIELVKADLKFGYDIKNITKDELQLILEEGQSLKYTTGETAATATRTLYLDWKHFDIFNTPYIFNINQLPNIFEDYKVYWLHYVDGLGENKDLPNEYAWNWETITNNMYLTQDIVLTTLYRTDQYKAVIEYKYKNNETIYYAESTGLVFDNKNVVAEPGASNSSQESLRIKLDKNDTGVYNIYGLDGRMTDSFYRGPYNIYFEFLDTTPLDRIENINWEFPSENTMIKDVVNTDKQQATFNIDTMYKPGAMNNRIWCTVILKTGEIRRGSLTLQFGEVAAAGSNYAFNIDFIGNRTCLYATGEDDSIEIQATFTKQNGEVMTVPTIKWSWMNNYDSPITLSNSTGEKITLTYNNSEVPKENYSILQATVENYPIDNGLTTDLTTYLPIPIAKLEYNYISGATRVVYDSNGNTATYSRNPYELYNLTNKIENTSWDIISNSTNDTFQLKTQNIRDENGDKIGEEKTLLPLSYIPQEPPTACVYCILNEEVVWSQPILIMQNRWEYDLLNEWNGKLNINDQNGYVLAPLLGAGKKENNEFTGVMMGDLKLANGTVTNTGLYGFKEGSRRFSFNDKGQAYIGTGDYYIDFDSENLTIKAKNFDLNANNGALIISDNEGIKLGDKISFQPNGTAIIGGWNIEKNKLYLQSENGNGIGMAAIGNSNLAFWAGYSGKGNTPWDDTEWENKTAFYVTSNGDIKATKGVIANWTIMGSVIQNIIEEKTSGNTISYRRTGMQAATSKNSVAFYAGTSNKSGSVKGESPFYVTHDGYLYSSQGTIGGWNINTNVLDSEHNGYRIYLASASSIAGGTTNWIRAYEKNGSGGITYFSVSSTGRLFAKDATISGTLEAGSIIGNGNDWKIGSDNYFKEEGIFFEEITSESQRCVLLGKTNLRTIWQPLDYTLNVPWYKIAKAGSEYGSDRNLKYNISYLSDNSENLDSIFDNLRPCLFNYNKKANAGSTEKIHIGYIAQDILHSMNQFDFENFAGLWQDEEFYNLNKQEFIALNTWQIQKLKTRVAELEKEIKEIKQNEI